MSNPIKTKLFLVLVVVVITLLALVGLPYSRFSWVNALSAYSNIPLVNGVLPELLTITCNTPVYDAPAGNVVGSNSVYVGQTFFKVGDVVYDSQGIGWIAIYVGAPNYPFIPIRCVR